MIRWLISLFTTPHQQILANPQLGLAHWVDVYTGPWGSGWVVNYSLTIGRYVYTRAYNYGPEEHKEHTWQMAVRPEPGP